MSDEISPLHTGLAIELSKIVHDKCENVPHDIGIELAKTALNASKIKLIFLDIDGVLNYELFYREQSQSERYKEVGHPLCDLSEHAVDLLNHIIDKTGAKVVVSSTWRKGRTVEELQELLEKVGFKGEIIGRTPSLYLNKEIEASYTIPRGCEIDCWLKNKFDWDDLAYVRYVILDDDSDMLYQQRENYFRIDGYCGLTNNVAYRVINFLNRG
jgi:hypothetical protein